MMVVVDKFLKEVEKKFSQWLISNPEKTDIEKINEYKKIAEKIYNDLLMDERTIINEYLSSNESK